jgi:hydrogenase maturation protease
MKTLVLALGNPILSDDSVGWRIADLLAARLPDDQFDFMKESGATFDLIRQISGYSRVIVLDAIQLGGVPPGTVHRFALTDLQATIRYSSAHDINFATAFEMGRQMGYPIPDDIRIYGIEAKELLHFSESCTPEVEARLPEIAETICRELL